MKLGFIGLGNMPAAIMNAVIGSKKVPAKEIIAASRDEETRTAVAEQLHVTVTADYKEAARNAKIIFLDVPVSLVDDIFDEIRGDIDNSKIVISIVPGGSLQWLEKNLADRAMGFNPDDEDDVKRDKLKIVRALPNIPTLTGMGMTAVCHNGNLTKKEEEHVLSLLRAFGEAQMVPEKLFSTVSNLTGTSPAIVFMMIEAMADAAVSGGLAREAAYIFAAQTVMGSANMVLSTGMHPAQLKDMVCTSDNNRIECVRMLEQSAFRSSVFESLRMAEQYAKAADVPAD